MSKTAQGGQIPYDACFKTREGYPSKWARRNVMALINKSPGEKQSEKKRTSKSGGKEGKKYSKDRERSERASVQSVIDAHLPGTLFPHLS